jgi:hypothetical protein
MGLLIHPRPPGGNALIVSGLNSAKVFALSFVEKLHLFSKN